MDTLRTVAQVCGNISAIIALVVLLVKPIREKLLGQQEARNARRCLLRAEMLRTYYKRREQKQIKQYELENFLLCYAAYKQLKGNSFIKRIHDEVIKWEVIQ